MIHPLEQPLIKMSPDCDQKAGKKQDSFVKAGKKSLSGLYAGHW